LALGGGGLFVISKLVETLIDAFREYYSARSRFGRRMKRLAMSLSTCNAAWHALSRDPGYPSLMDSEKRCQLAAPERDRLDSLQDTHRLAVKELADAIRDLDFMLEMFSPDARAALQGYTSLEAMVHSRDAFDEYVKGLIAMSTPADFDEAASKLGEFVRKELKPEELV
jgi:hypothetical protein